MQLNTARVILDDKHAIRPYVQYPGFGAVILQKSILRSLAAGEVESMYGDILRCRMQISTGTVVMNE